MTYPLLSVMDAGKLAPFCFFARVCLRRIYFDDPTWLSATKRLTSRERHRTLKRSDGVNSIVKAQQFQNLPTRDVCKAA